MKTAAVKAIADIKGVNGIAYSNGRLFTNSFSFDDLKGGEIGVITNGVYKKVGSIQGAFDGMAVVDENTLLVSEWGALDKPAGYLLKIDLRSGKAIKLDGAVMGGPADFYYDGKVYVPALLEGKIVIRQL